MVMSRKGAFKKQERALGGEAHATQAELQKVRRNVPAGMPSHMYKESRQSINFHVGCKFDCTYCRPTFQRQMKRQKWRCMKCYDYVPHPHLERLDNAPPKTQKGEFIFFPSSSDWAFIPIRARAKAIRYMKQYPDRLFLCQSKDPGCFWRFKFPENAILGTTIETNLMTTMARSHAPATFYRYWDLKKLVHPLKMVTVEPIMEFTLKKLIDWITDIDPWRVYVGYDSHPAENKLPEPLRQKTMTLVNMLRYQGLDVRTKLIREAWDE